LFSAVRKLFRHHLDNEKNIERFVDLLNNTVRSKDLSDLTLLELSEYCHSLESELLKKRDVPVINDFFTMTFYGLLKNTAKNWCGLEDENQFNGLLRNTGDIISAEPARRVREMAEMVSGNEELIELLMSDNIYEIESNLPNAIMEKADAYLEKFGDRCINELKLESETLNDDPLPFYRAVGNFALKLKSGKTIEIKDDFDEKGILKKAGLKQPLFKWILKNARKTIKNRENLRFERTRVFGAVRSIFKEIGMRFASFGVLDNADDVFYLEYGEVLAYIEGTSTTLNLRGLADVRKKEYASFSGNVPDRFETYDGAYLSQRHIRENEQEIQSSGTLKGLGCCPGIVRGRARVITDPKGAVIHHGEILVAQRTDPGWIMLFPVASGVLVEYGSLLSHAAIVVREMGIPAVVSVKDLLAQVKTGDMLELDGEKGLVTKIAE
jgi:pyruvate,water dikinase